MGITKDGNKKPNAEKRSSTIVAGSATYKAPERNNESDLKCAWDAYADAISRAKQWISDYERSFENSAVVYKTSYLGPAKITHAAAKPGNNAFTVIQSIRVTVREVKDEDFSCDSKVLEYWESRQKESEELGFNPVPPLPGSLNPIPGQCGNIPNSVYTIIRGTEGTSWKEDFEHLLQQLELIKGNNSIWDDVQKCNKGLINSCDEFEMLNVNKLCIRAGMKITMPFVYEFEKPHLKDFIDVPEIKHL